MNKIISNILNSVSRVGSKALFKVKKASPEILIGGGIAVIFAGTIIACCASTKLNDILHESENEITDIENEANASLITEDDKKNLIRHEKVKLVGKLIKIYAVPAAMVTSGITMILVSHGIMKKREATLLTAYNALDLAFKKYREQVLADENGAIKDRKYMTGDHPTDDILNDNEIDDINRQSLSLMNVNSPYGPYTFEYSRHSTTKWSPDPLSNLNTIRSAEDWANRQLRLFGHVFLNDILKYLGIDEVPWGQICGWIRGNQNGDNYIQILATEDRIAGELDNDCWKKPIFLEFNCDGAIWDKI